MKNKIIIIIFISTFIQHHDRKLHILFGYISAIGEPKTISVATSLNAFKISSPRFLK